MIDFQQKRKFNNIVYSKLSILILIILIIFLARATYNLYNKFDVSSGDYLIVKKDYENLKARKEMLDSEIDRLKTPNGIEEEIRSKFNVAKPGETVVVIVDSSTSPSEGVNQGRSFWSSFLGMFGY